MNMIMFETVSKLLEKRLGGAEFALSLPEISGRGHLSTNAAFILAESEKISPMEAALTLKKYLEGSAPDGFFHTIEIAEPGFLNFWFTERAIQNEFAKALEAGEGWGRPFDSVQGGHTKESKETVIVEYSQPNIAKPMHVGHLRSTIIGDALANIFEFTGRKVIRWNYIGDWGTQFGKLIAVAKKKNPQEALTNIMRDVKASVAVYKEFAEETKNDPELEEEARKEFKKLEDGDKENKALWEESVKASREEIEKVYDILGIKFDVWKGESSYEKELEPLIKRLKKDGIAKESEGALIVPLDDEGLPPGLIRKSDGATLYLTRDIASLEDRINNYKPDTILYVVDNGQSLHFQQLFAVAKKIGIDASRAHHVKFGLVLSEDMKRLSTRSGRHIPLMDVISEAISRARAVVDEKQPELSDVERERISKIIGIGALKYNDLSQNRMSDITLNWDKMLSLEGNSGPYLQYTYARLKSILRKADNVSDFEVGALVSEADHELMLKLLMFPETIESVIETYFPHYLANYLYSLAREVNSYYEKEPVLKAEPAVRNARLHLVQLAADVMRTGLSLLGIGVVERM